MSFLITVICFAFAITSYYTTKKFYNPLLLFNAWWGVSIFFSGLGLFDLYIPSTTTYFIFLISIISFNIPQLIKFTSEGKGNDGRFDEVDRNVNQNKIIRKLVYLNIIIIIILLPRAMKAINLLMSGIEYSTVRYLYYYGQDDFMSLYDHMFTNWVITPVIYFNMILLSILFFNNNKERFSMKLFTLTTFISLGLFSFSSGSRGLVIKFAIILMLSFFIHSKKIRLNSFKKFRLRTIIISSLIILVYMTIVRSGIEENALSSIFKTVTSYFTGPFIYFEKLHEFAYVNNDKIYLFGGMFFSGIIDIFVLMMRFIGANILQPSYYLSEYNQTFLLIGTNSYYNAFPTMIYSFFFDFGYIGIILGPLLFGIISKRSYEKLIYTNTIASKGIYILISLSIYESTMKWWGTSSTFWLTIILFIIYDKAINRKTGLKVGKIYRTNK